MALFVEVVSIENSNVVRVEGAWEDGHPLQAIIVPREPNMTVAESVEFYLLSEHNLVASWLWSEDRRYGKKVLIGQFVTANPDGSKPYKEVTNSLAHRFTL